jgi:choline-glycine betaine transporter
MLELYFLFRLIPRTISPLAKQQNRSSFAWCFIAIVAWFVTQFVVAIIVGASYMIVASLMDWNIEISGFIRLIMYVCSLAGAFGSLTLIRRYLSARPQYDAFPAPPPPPTFG